MINFATKATFDILIGLKENMATYCLLSKCKFVGILLVFRTLLGIIFNSLECKKAIRKVRI